MSKEFFRYLRGELNGFYVTRMNSAMNSFTKDVKEFFSSFKNQQFIDGKIDDKNLYGLGKFASIFLPRLSKAESISSLRLTESHIEDNFEFSERGLFDVNFEVFRFFHLKDDIVAFFYFVRENQDNYNTDINTEATSADRSSLIGNEEVLGYISSDETDLFDEYGNIKENKVLSSPPEDKAYSEFYGNEFLFLSEGNNSKADNLIRIRMTDSNEIGDVEYSERGLFVIPLIMFEDINNLATENLRSSMVGDEDVIGYISSEETNVLDDKGNVRLSKILANPPDNVAYSDYYGNQFLFLSEAEQSYTNLEPSLYIEMFKAIQWIKYNGTSLKSLTKIVELTCPEGLVTINSVKTASDGKHFLVYYDYNAEASINLKQQRLNLLEYIVKMKFIQVTLVENV